ncbi:hypothetical protein [Streptomyces roseifaciens]|uniref:hypothetical protein n=1 Tax=Streptomyces roseifaciens TaxID=1488406 RepID=UPI000717ED38|nr:hypothetical protein [Streptomyces roseifaciens]
MTEPADRRTALAALRAAGVPGRLYRIEGVHEPEAPLPDFHFLRLREGSWETGLFERGEYVVTARFPAAEEAAACRQLLLQLIPDG